MIHLTCGNGKLETKKPRRVRQHSRGVENTCVRGALMAQRTCMLDGCQRPRIYRLYCNAHHRRWKRTGDPGPVEVKGASPGPPVCRFSGCERQRRSDGLCSAHYLQQFHGKPLTPIKPRVDRSVRDEHGRKQCNTCRDWLPTSDFHPMPKGRTRDKLSPLCMRCHRSAAIQRNYGITLDEYEAMHAKQGGVCAICGGVNDDGRNLHVDHDHATGAVRGLLCIRCNRGIGMFLDNVMHLETAIAYLKKSQGAEL